MEEIDQFDLCEADLLPENFPVNGILIPESDYGLAEIYLNKNGEYDLYEIPMYGGNPMYYGKPVKDPAEVVKLIRSWT